jgi:site-specific DNA recombinase
MKPAIQKCAIYTRKSHEKGLEQELNTLDAQREACLAYITSQKSEGTRSAEEQGRDACERNYLAR